MITLKELERFKGSDWQENLQITMLWNYYFTREIDLLKKQKGKYKKIAQILLDDLDFDRQAKKIT